MKKIIILEKKFSLIASPGKSSHHDSEDDLNDTESVNLVALEEVHPKGIFFILKQKEIIISDEKTTKRQRLVTTGETKAMEVFLRFFFEKE